MYLHGMRSTALCCRCCCRYIRQTAPALLKQPHEPCLDILLNFLLFHSGRPQVTSAVASFWSGDKLSRGVMEAPVLLFLSAVRGRKSPAGVVVFLSLQLAWGPGSGPPNDDQIFWADTWKRKLGDHAGGGSAGGPVAPPGRPSGETANNPGHRTSTILTNLPSRIHTWLARAHTHWLTITSSVEWLTV